MTTLLTDERLRRWLEEYTKLKPDNDYRDMDVDSMFKPESAFTTRLEVSAYVHKRREAAAKHRSEISPFETFPTSMHAAVFSHDYFELIHPRRNSASDALERDLFEGISEGCG